MTFADREEAGRLLAEELLTMRWLQDRPHGRRVVVLGLPRGGVPVAARVAEALGHPWDIIVVRKLGLPGNPEVAMGAVGEDGVRVVDPDAVLRASVSGHDLAMTEARAIRTVSQQVEQWRRYRPALPLTGCIAIIVDDGAATGATARAACRVARQRGAVWVVLAVPVGPTDLFEVLGEDVDEVVCLNTPTPFRSVGQAYRSFDEVTDSEVTALLADPGNRI